MAVICDSSGRAYHPEPFTTEAAFENSVVSLADQIFGTTSIYVDIKKKLSGNTFVTIPDGYLIDMADPAAPKLFIIENEIVSHDPFKHVGVQMLKFVTSFEDARTSVRQFLMKQIAADKDALKRLEDGTQVSGSRNIDSYLDKAVYTGFRGLVIIDEARPELHRVLEKINADISVLEVRRFVADDGSRLFQFDTLYDEEESEGVSLAQGIEDPKVAAEKRAARLARLAKSDTIVVPAREEGYRNTFLGEDRWHAIRIGAAMKDKLKYIAGYQVAPISSVTHIAEIKYIRPYEDTGKYVVVFKGPAKELTTPIPIKDGSKAPQGPVYVRREDLMRADYLEQALE